MHEGHETKSQLDRRAFLGRATLGAGALAGATGLQSLLPSLAAAKASLGQSDGTGRAVVAERFAAIRRTEDFVEGPRAFVGKRAPVWKAR